LLAHPCFLGQLENLIEAVTKLKSKQPESWQRSADAKVLAAIRHLILEAIPQDPNRSEYRQGNTHCGDRKHWFRARFGGSRFRLFFRFSTANRLIIYAWVNDSETLRAYGSKSGAYKVFASMLDKANPDRRLPGFGRRQGVSRYLGQWFGLAATMKRADFVAIRAGAPGAEHGTEDQKAGRNMVGKRPTALTISCRARVGFRTHLNTVSFRSPPSAILVSGRYGLVISASHPIRFSFSS
jgi:toxin YhaV